MKFVLSSSKLIALALVTLPGLASAINPIRYSYTVTTTNYAVSNLISVLMYPSGATSFRYGYDATRPYNVGPYSQIGWSDSLADYPGFPPELIEPASKTLVFGIATNLPGDAPGQKHAVIGAGTAFADAAQGVAWGTLFPTTLESNIIAAIEDVSAGRFSQFSVLSTFMDTDASIVRGAPGNQYSAVFNPSPISFSGSNFKLVAFSDGQTIAQGSIQAAPVPEPTTLGIVGLAGLLLKGRRRKRPS